MRQRITGVDVGNSAFKRDVKALPPDIRSALTECLKELIKDPTPSRLRLHGLHREHRGIFSVDVTPNHAYKATFTVEGGIARMRRVGSHKQIDRTP